MPSITKEEREYLKVVKNGRMSASEFERYVDELESVCEDKGKKNNSSM